MKIKLSTIRPNRTGLYVIYRPGSRNPEIIEVTESREIITTDKRFEKMSELPQATIWSEKIELV